MWFRHWQWRGLMKSHPKKVQPLRDDDPGEMLGWPSRKLKLPCSAQVVEFPHVRLLRE